ncbi:hypothetical protein CMALT430_170003 [Carnobacterium maltaromaticum]|nr:hypothetical protein CMALT430_170003 [Carnobacterium maltaromaticum]
MAHKIGEHMTKELSTRIIGTKIVKKI